MKINNKILYIIFFVTQIAHTTQLIQGNVTPIVSENGCATNVTTTFDVTINTATYDKATGAFWVGLARGGNTYAISSFQRIIDSGEVPRFQAHATSSTLNNKSIASLAVIPNYNNNGSGIAGTTTSGDIIFLLGQQDNATTNDEIRLFSAVSGQNGSTGGTLESVIANNSFIFAPIANGTYGDPESGIAVVAINQTNGTLTQTAAVPGDTGIKAQQLDNLSPSIRINGDTSTRYPTIRNSPALAWDPILERLFMGTSLDSQAAQLAGDGLRSITVAQVTQSPALGTLPLFDFAPSSVFNSTQNALVGTTLATNGQSVSLTANHLGVLHANSGPSYLILAGGNGTAGNQIFALPLVDVGDANNATQGTLADKNSYNTTTRRFETAVSNNIGLTFNTDTFAQVGAGPLPLDPSQSIYQMEVIDNAVYVSFANAQSSVNETGLLFSQALFDQNGKIYSWTPWSKRAWPLLGFPDSATNGQVSFFAVDATTGKIIAVDGDPQQTVRITQWKQGDTPCPGGDICQTNCSLAAAISRSLCNGAYSVLDLDQSTKGIGPSVAYRYALFGGIDKVDITLISNSLATTAPFDINASTGLPYPQNVTQNFCDSTTFKETSLPYQSGCVTTLEYSRRTTDQGNTNYFFAGTPKGLFAFAHQDGTGFNVTELSSPDTGIIADGSWHAIANITDAVIDIKSSGNSLYVLTFATSCQTPFASTLYRFNYQDNLTDMFDLSNQFIIAQSGTASTSATLSNTLIFNAIDIIQTNNVGTQEQLVLATNNGLLQSQATNGVQSAIDELQANWILIKSDTLFYGIGSVDNARIKTTDWPFNAQDACGYGTFERSSIYQLSGTNNTDPFAFTPLFFDYAITNLQCAQPAFEKISYFWSDGARRFFIINPVNGTVNCLPFCDKKTCCCPFERTSFLQVTPYNLCQWTVCNPLLTVLQDCVLRDIPAFYWVRAIGMTGIVLAGTPNGVVALQ